MGVLIIILLPIIVWKMIDLAKQKDARLKMEAAQKVLAAPPQGREQRPIEPFAFDFTLESGEVILETTSAAGGLWLRIGKDGKTSRIILVDFTGKTIGRIDVKRDNEKTVPVT